MLLPAAAALAVALPLVQAVPWAQPVGAPAHSLFERQSATKEYPPVGAVPPVSGLPQEWLDKLKSATIANVPVSTPVVGTDNAVTYPTGTNLQSPEVCAFTTGCTRADDIFGLPEGIFGLTFDDGPGAGTKVLSDFLESKQMSSHATHFFIGGQITRQPDGFDLVFGRGGHIAGHTWSHPRLTSKTNEEIVAELGWTMQIIFDKTGGRIPQYWRPPFGDLDERVRDIAKNVFGLQTVLWNSDTNDWKIAAEGKQVVEKVFDQWATGPKSPGHSVLMHEINLGTVEVFISKYDIIEQNGWKFSNVAEAIGQPMYANAADSKSEVDQKSSILGAAGSPPPAPPSNSGGSSSQAPVESHSAAPSGGSLSSSSSPSGAGTPSAAPAPAGSASRLSTGIAGSVVALLVATFV